jgi:hypothetical protein
MIKKKGEMKMPMIKDKDIHVAKKSVSIPLLVASTSKTIPTSIATAMERIETR